MSAAHGARSAHLHRRACRGDAQGYQGNDEVKPRTTAEKCRVINGKSHSMRTCHEEETRTAGAELRHLALPAMRTQGEVQPAQAEGRAALVRAVQMGGAAA